MVNKLKQQAEKRIKSAMRKLANDDKLLKEMAISIKAFSKLNGREMQVLLNHHKRIEDNARWLTLREVFGELYFEIDKEKKRLDKILKKYERKKDKEGQRRLMNSILTIGINVKNNIIRVLEMKLRKKYGYWKSKKRTSKVQLR